MVSDLYYDCIRKLRMLDKQTNDPWKLLAKKLAFCLEDAISIAKLAHEIWTSREEENSKSMFFSLYRHCIKCVKIALTDINVKVQAIGLLMLKNVAQKEFSEGVDAKIQHFFLFFTGELLEDIFFLVHDTVKKPMSRQSIVVCEECLRFLFLFHTRSQGGECLQFSMNLLLESIFMVFSAPFDVHSQEFNEVRTISMRLISHLVQVPSSATQIREFLSSMPTSRRELLQDIIRSSISQGQYGSQVKSSNPSPIINLPVQLDIGATQSQQQLVSDSPLCSHEEAPKEGGGGGDDDDDDDWDAFQSFPTADTATGSSHSETASLPVSEFEHQSPGPAPITVSDKANDEEIPDGVKDNTNTSIACENGTQYPSMDEQNVLETKDIQSELVDACDTQPANDSKDLENDQNFEDVGKE
uniref:Uncharacterized protein n=2 Tax=Anthurium amnicola TaxID=1678845 RepID=A0A1D1XDF5_9ARAE